MSSTPKSEVLRDLYWRSEILLVMYWLRGEGLGDVVDVPMLQRYIDIDGPECRTRLAHLVESGEVVPDGSWYALSPAGLAEGEEEFASLFADLARPGPGECSDDCWCQLSTAEEAACRRRRRPTVEKGPVSR